MKASISIVKLCSGGFNLISKRTSRPYSFAALVAVTSTCPCSFEDQDFLFENSISVNEQDHDLLSSPTSIPAKREDLYDERSPDSGGKNMCEFFSEKGSLSYQKAEGDDEWKRIKLILKCRRWNLGSHEGSYNEIPLDECNVIRILSDLFEESRNAALPLYFFRWWECYTRSKHTIRSISIMMHILIAGNMNHRAVDLVLCLVRMNNGEDWWLDLLFKVLQETSTEKRTLITAYSMLVDSFVKENMTYSALKFSHQMKRYNFFPSARVCNTLLRALLQSGQIELAWDFVEKMQSREMALNATIFSLFIHHYCIKGDIRSGWKLLTEMKNYGINPDIVVYTILIDSLSKMSLLSHATSMLFKLSKLGISLDSVSLSSVINGFCKGGNPQKAMIILENFNISPNIYVYNSFISRLCADCNIDAATGLFVEMVDLGLFPDCFSYTTIIGGYCKIMDMYSALKFLGMMLKRGIKPSVTTFTTLVQGYCKSGDLDKAEHLFQNMIRDGFVPDVVSYNILMDSYAKKGHLHKAFGLLDNMKSAGVSPDTVTYNSVIHCLIVRGYVREAKDLLDELVERGFSPDVITFTDIVGGFSKRGNFEEAFLVWFYMSESNIKPDVVACSSLLSGYCRENRMSEADALFKKMLDVGLVPDVMLYNILIHGFCRVGNIDEALELIKMMVEQSVNPNEATHQALVLGYKKKWVQNPEHAAAFKIEQIILKYGFNQTPEQL